MMLLKRWIRRVPLQDRTRALTKTVLYRVVMVGITISVALFYTGDPIAAINIGIITNAIKTVTYYGYERVWDRIEWGISSTSSNITSLSD